MNPRSDKFKKILVDTHLVKGEQYNVFGFYDGDCAEGEFYTFNLVSNSTGVSLTNSGGGVFFERPTRQDVIEVVKDYMEETGNSQAFEGIE